MNVVLWQCRSMFKKCRHPTSQNASRSFARYSTLCRGYRISERLIWDARQDNPPNSKLKNVGSCFYENSSLHLEPGIP